MAITNAQKTKLNKSNRAMQNVNGGTILQNVDGFVSGSHTITDAEINASAISIDVGITGVVGFMVQRYMSGSQISDIKVINSGSILDITAGSGSPLAIGDVFYWITM